MIEGDTPRNMYNTVLRAIGWGGGGCAPYVQHDPDNVMQTVLLEEDRSKHMHALPSLR